MLDECKGALLEEVLYSFALLVLRNATKARETTEYELACSDQLDSQQSNRLLPLILAYRSSLQQQILQRQIIRRDAEAYTHLLSKRQASIKHRRAALAGLSDPVHNVRPNILTGKVRNSWSGDDRWAELINNGSIQYEDSLLNSPFEIGWQNLQKGLNTELGRPTSLLDDLTARITKHEIRLKGWKAFQVSLERSQGRIEQKSTRRPPALEKVPATVQLDKHQMLQIASQIAPEHLLLRSTPSRSSHRALLASMRADLAALSQPKASTITGTTQFTKVARSPKKPTGIHSMPPSPIAEVIVHVSPEVAGRLEIDMFTSPTQALVYDTGDLHTPLPRAGNDNIQVGDWDLRRLGRLHASAGLHNELPSEGDSHESQVHESVLGQSLFLQNNEQSIIPTTCDQTESSQAGVARTIIFNKHQNPQIPPETPTRKMAAPKKGETELHKLQPQELPHCPEQDMDPLKVNTYQLPARDVHMRNMAPPPTLLERTRQSMSLLPNPAGPGRDHHSRKSVSLRQPRTSQNFPVNQFETPREKRTQDMSVYRTKSPHPDSSNQRDQSLDDEDDYASVFKSRPKIALSPALSPDRSGFGLDSMLEEELADLTLSGYD